MRIPITHGAPRLVFSAAAAAASAAGLVNLLAPSLLDQLPRLLPLIAACAVFLFPLFWWVVPQAWAYAGSSSPGLRWRLLSISLLAGLTIPAVVPFGTARSTRAQTLFVTAVGEVFGVASGGPVELATVSIDGHPFSLFNAQSDGHWSGNEGRLVANARPARLEFSIPIREWAELMFRSGTEAGVVEIDFQGSTQYFRLSSPHPFRTVTLRAFAPMTLGGMWVYAGYVILVGLATWGVGVWLCKRPHRPATPAGPHFPCGLFYAAPCAVSWSLHLLAFYPGLMSWDSLYQWKQMTLMKFDSIHPVFHTLTNWLITRIWFSPAAVALAQVLIVSAIVGTMLAFLDRRGTPRWFLAGVSIWLAVLPSVACTTITLWKDVWFTAALMAVTVILGKMLDTSGKWLTRSGHIVLFALALGALTLYRYNGIVPALATIAACAALFRSQRARVGVLAVLYLAFIVIYFGPVQRVLKVYQGSNFSAYAVPLQQLAAVVHDQRSLPNGGDDFLSRVLPRDAWAADYYPYNHGSLISNRLLDVDFFVAHRSDFFHIWARTFLRYPIPFVRAWLDQTSILWRINEEPGAYTYTVPREIEHNEFGLRSRSLLSGVPGGPTGFMERSERVPWKWLVWRPALWFWISVWFAALAAARNGPRNALPILPLLANTAGLFLTTGSQEVRYAFPAFLVAPVMIAWFLSTPPAR